MEKISYPPLIAHLQQNADWYNQLFLDDELKHGSIDRQLLSKWLVAVIEPLIREITQHQQEALPNVFKAFYAELVPLLGSGKAVRFEQELQRLWALCAHIPSIVNHAPAKVIKALGNALEAIYTYQPTKTLLWIDFMNKTISSCESFDEVLHCGRMNAWFCGLAHLREKCKGLYPGLSVGLRNALQACCPLSQPVEKIFSQSWIDKENPVFIEGAGGFVGFDGNFMQPPLLGDAGDYVLAGDTENVFLLFADEFGRLLLPSGADHLVANKNIQPLKELEKKYGKSLSAFDDVSSCVVKNNTVFFTRNSSHYIYIYGWSDGN